MKHTAHHIKDSIDLVSKLRDKILPPTDILASFDLTNMFTNIPVDEATEVIRDMLNNDHTLHERTSIPVDTITELLQASMSMAYFVWQGIYYSQVRGCAMGSSTCSPISEAYMTKYESRATTAYNTNNPDQVVQGILQFWYRKAETPSHPSTHNTSLLSMHDLTASTLPCSGPLK
jgi:hypothetical protein